MYKTYFQHYNEPPVGKIILRGRVIGDKYRRCYLAKGKVKQEQDLVKHKAKPGRIDREKFPKLTQVRTRARNIECPSCRRNGVLNVASNKSNPEKTTFYVRHEKSRWNMGQKQS